MLDWELEDWITDVGADLVDRRLLEPTSLTPTENLIYEIWLLDTEARNGGLSQYFLNHGLAQWQACKEASKSLTSFQPFVETVDRILGNASDPFEAIRSRGTDAEDLWYKYQSPVVIELRQLCASAS